MYRSEREGTYSNRASLSGNSLEQYGAILPGNSLEQATTAITDDVECNRVIKSRIGTNDETREQILGSSKAKRNDSKVELTVVETKGQIEQRVTDRDKKGKDNKENKNDSNSKNREPCKLLYLNAQGLINKYTKRNKLKYTKWKVDAIKEYVNNNNVILMNFTETWLQKNIQDEKLPDFTTYRCDRKSKKSKGGGTAIYLKKGYEARLILEDRVEDCEIVAIYIEKLNIINIVIYRPPDTKSAVFALVLNKVKKLLSQMEAPEPTVIVSGDFNFRFIQWTRGELNGCKWRMKTYSQAKEDEKRQFFKMMDVMDSFHLTQTIQEPTRKENTLDLVFTNNTNIFTQIDVSKTILSDHDLIEITTNIPDENSHMKNFEAEIQKEDMI